MVPAVAWLAWGLFGPAAAGLAAWMLAACPLIQSMGAGVLSQPTATLFSTLALALTMPGAGAEPRRGGWKPFLAAGALAALAGASRQELNYLSPAVLAAALWGRGRRDRRASLLGALAGIVLVTAAFAGAIRAAGWTDAYASKGTMNFSLSSRGIREDAEALDRTIYGLTPDGRFAEDTAGKTLPREQIAPLVRRALRLWPTIAANLMTGLGSPLPLLLAPIAVLVIRWPRGRRIAPWTLAGAAAFPVAMTSFFQSTQYYLLTGIPALLVLAAGSVTAAIRPGLPPPAGDAEPERPRPIGLRSLALWAALLVLVPAPRAVHRPVRENREVPRVFRETGAWMKANLPPGKMLASTGTYISYYAGVPEYSYMPAAPAETIVLFARRGSYKYLVIDGWTMFETRPGLRELLEGDEALAQSLGLRQLYTNGLKIPHRTAVFELLPAPLPPD